MSRKDTEAVEKKKKKSGSSGKSAAKSKKSTQDKKRTRAPEKAAVKLTKAEKLKKRRRRTIARIVRRVLLSLFTLIALVVFGAYELLGEIFKGPSQTAGDILTVSLLESSAGKFVPYLYYSADEVENIKNRNRLIESEEETNTSLIVIETPEPVKEGETPAPAEDDITVETVTGATYKGWMLIVKDPSRVKVGVSSDNFSEGRGGMHIDEIAEKYNAVAAINGGAFADSGGTGNGGMPSGHSATVTALAVTSGIEYGCGSPVFAVCVILAIIVMHDAMGVRWQAGQHARTIHELLLKRSDTPPEELLEELLGHTPLQVAAGARLGALVAILYTSL